MIDGDRTGEGVQEQGEAEIDENCNMQESKPSQKNFIMKILKKSSHA